MILADSILLLSLLASLFQPQRECVVLLHGLGRTSLSMSRIEYALRQDGYLVVNKSYPSLTNDIPSLTPVVGQSMDDCRRQGSTSIHFVTHSLGGILVRSYFQDHKAVDAKRIVMLGPPNQGSEIVDTHFDEWWFQRAAGPVGQQLGTIGDQRIFPILKPVPLEIGVIAGTLSIDPLLDRSLPKPNDGIVSVRSTMLPEMKDFVTVEQTHTFMVYSAEVINLTRFFLKNGSFPRHLFQPDRF